MSSLLLLLVLVFVACSIFSEALSVASSSSWSHEAMQEFQTRLEILENGAPESLASFYEPQLNSFSVQPGASRLSITSTCYALQAMMATENTALYDQLVDMDPKLSQTESDKTPVQTILRALLMSDWREEDLFQVPLLLSTVLSVDQRRDMLGTVDEQIAAQLRALLSAVLKARPRRRYGIQQNFSEYILFQCTQVYAEVYDSSVALPINDLDETTIAANTDEMFDSERPVSMSGLPENALPTGAASEVGLALSRCAEVSYNTLCRQMALRVARDESDVMELAYSLLTYAVATTALAGTAGREVIPGQGPLPGSRSRPVNRKLIEAALAAFFAEQRHDGLWDKGQPIYRSFRRTGRNVGNAFVYSVDTVASLLHWLPPENFRPHLSGLKKVLEWVEQHQNVEILADYCDPETGRCTGRAIRGWISPHLTPETGPQAWSTAQTLACISRMKTIIETVMHEDVLEEFRGMKLSEKGPVAASWDRLLDSDLGKCGLDHPCTLKKILYDRMISARLSPYDESLLSESYSAILFGPPGTAKTTIAKSLAERIGWDFLVIDTSVFLADGLTNVASRIRYVFERLRALRRCVILFDEIEEFCLDRESAGVFMESRLLTTAMLTAINDLRREENSIFFLATNRLRAFDAAITRPGRFDMQLFVGTPNRMARTLLLRQKLEDVAVDDDTKQEAIQSYETFLEKYWEEDAKFMNYLEGLKFAGACANLVAKGTVLEEEQLLNILNSQKVVMTVRGAVREEFVASMTMTRL